VTSPQNAASAAYWLLVAHPPVVRPFQLAVLTSSLAHVAFASRSPLLRGLQDRLSGRCDTSVAASLLAAADLILQVPIEDRVQARDMLLARLAVVG
jgi:hypothetical protein